MIPNAENMSDEAKARYARFWGALPLTSEQRAAQRPQLYVENSYQGLGGYEQNRPLSKWEQQANESDFSYTARLRGAGLKNLADTLPADVLERVSQSYNQAQQRIDGTTPDHAELRSHLAGRQDGTGVGLLGRDEKAAGQAAIAAQSVRANSMSREPIAQLGGSSSNGRGPERVFLSQLKDGPAVPEHQDVSQLRSSGIGWMTTR